MQTQLVRSIEVFEKQSDEFVCEYPLDTVHLAFLQDLFGEPRTDLMLEGYKINAAQARKLEPFINEKIDTEKYDCFLTCYTRTAD